MWLSCKFGHIGSRPCPQLDWEVLQAGLKLHQDPHPNLQIPECRRGKETQDGVQRSRSAITELEPCLSTALDLGELLLSPSLPAERGQVTETTS